MSVKREGTAAAAAAAAADGSNNHSSSSSVDRKRRSVDPAERAIFHSPPDGNTFRLLIATDTHLGYNELDPIRGQDSFNTFREILECARANHVDFVLLGGDLFHDNKPSRATLCKAVDILREFAFGEAPITFEIISDQTRNFPTTKTVNYEDANHNVSLPIFSIHGNHDDATSSGSTSYSVMDVLHGCALVNYFGKIDRVDSIINYPILITKGVTKLALYGMGNVRDERLHRTFEMEGVKWEKPQQDPARWFNMCVVHQNRTRHSQTQRDYLPEKFLPPWLDMVIWGHEHESCPDPVDSADGQYVVIQPGSSVATSLSGGEAVEKKVVIMEIMSDQYRTVPIPLYTTRPFVMSDVRLSDELDPLDANQAQVEAFLTDKVNELILKLKSDPHYQNPDRPELPLIRLRVEYTGFPRIPNVNKFGGKFVGKVANPEDLLLFAKQRAIASRGKSNGTADDGKQLDAFLHGDASKIPPIHELVSLLIRQQKGSLNVLTESKMAEYVDAYVNKKDLDSIHDGVAKSIKQMAAALKADEALQEREAVSVDDVERSLRKKHGEMIAVERQNEAKHKEAAKNLADMFGIDLNLDPPMREGTLSEAEEMDDDGDEEMATGSKKKKTSTRAKAAGSTTTSRRGRGRGAAASRATSSRAKAPARGRKKKVEDEDEEDDEKSEMYDEDGSDEEWGARPKSKSKAKGKSRRKVIADDDDDEDDGDGDSAYIPVEEDDVEEDAPPAKKSRQTAPTRDSTRASTVRMTAPRASPTKKRSRTGTLQLSTTGGSAASRASLIDLSQADELVPAGAAAAGSSSSSSRAAAAAVKQDESSMGDVEDITHLSSGWGAPRSRRK